MADLEQLERLKQGVEAWNEWRKGSPGVKVDLSESNLHEINLKKVNLAGANLCKTYFRSTDLEEANLEDAVLIAADFSLVRLNNALLRRTNFREANLSGAILRDADLEEAKLVGACLRKATLVGAKMNGADLRLASVSEADLVFVHLCEAKLTEVNFSQADLYGADLSRADLAGANFRRTQAQATNFTGANFTGACIEDWNINSQTKLDDVECDYIYLEYPDQERRPSDPNRNFEPGEFTKLFQEARNTFDLILHNGINWRAFAFAFNETNTKVIDEYGDRLFLRGYELLGDGMVKLKISYPEGTNRQKYQNLLEDNYELLKENKGLLKENIRLQVKNYENMLSLPGQVTVIGNNNLVDTRNINTGGGSYYETINTGGGNYIQGNYVNMSQDLTEAAGQIQELLTQLQKTGVTVETAQEQVATDLANQAKSDPTVMGKLVGWGQTLANKAGETTVSEAVKAVVPMALKMLGIPL